MPRPNVLKTIDWPSVFETAHNYESWIAAAEFPENAQSMEQKRKVVQLSEDDKSKLSSVGRPVHVLAIAEDWCGDVVRHVPVLQKIADFCPNLVVKYCAREENPEVFTRFLTNGGEAVPKFVFLSDKFVECGNWGPMSTKARELISRGKACGDVATARALVAKHYEADIDLREVIDELISLCEVASCTL